MIHQFTNFDDFVSKAQEIGITSDLKALLTLDIIFYEEYEDFLVVSLVDFDSQPNKILVISEKECLIYPEIINVKHQLYSGTHKGKGNSVPHKGKGNSRESTVTMFLSLKKILGSYTAYYEKLNRQVEHVGQSLDLDDIEEVDRKLKKFSDVVHSYESLLIEMEESTLKFVNVEVIGYDYDLLLAKATHLSELCRGLKGELSIVRDKTEVRFSKELNRNIVRLTQIMAYLTIITVVISIPNTVGSLYGMNVPVGILADPVVVLIVLLITTVASIALSYYYMRKWLI